MEPDSRNDDSGISATAEDQQTIDTLVALSRRYGSDPRLVLGGGGNTSAKIGDRLFVKASGCELGSIGPEGFVEMDRAALAALVERPIPDDVDEREAMFKEATLAARVDPEDARRPSVETVLHHLAPGRFVVHTHPTLVNMIACCERGEELIDELFGADALWLPYVDPGFVLARTFEERLGRYRERTGRDAPEAFVMGNHGLIVCGDSAEEIHDRTRKTLDRIEKRLSEALAPGGADERTLKASDDQARQWIETIAPALRALLTDNGLPEDPLKIVAFDDSPHVARLVGSKEGKFTAAAGPVTPEQVVVCRSYPLWFRPDADEAPAETVRRLRVAVDEYRERHGFAPAIVLAEGLGLFAAGRDLAEVATRRAIFKDSIEITFGAESLGGARHMPRRDHEFIEHWEIETYRRGLADSTGPRGRVEGKVAVVTGAAQGFGLEIARDLSAQGATVALADLNADGAQMAARDINDSSPKPRAMGLAMDVTEAGSVDGAFHQIARAFGGFDILISNAGVLKAESVKTQPEADFDLVTAVNYKGYFLCVQRAAPIMAVQHLAAPERWADIIQINSKSGLVGSNRNFAYAGSKFGGIGLTQSFALELIEDGIKVNSICPGNYFDGPLWSDPDNGLFVQYLRAGKVPGARTIEDVRRYYEAKVPMGRGCEVADVMRAITYLIDQRYETGQALPVTGGQVMLR